MSAVTATSEQLGEILSGPDITPLPSPPTKRRPPYFESESGRNLIDGAASLLKNAIPPLLGMLLFVGLWALISYSVKNIPGPSETWHSAVELFSDPFYDNGPNDQGIGWNILNSLYRVGIGFGAAALARTDAEGRASLVAYVTARDGAPAGLLTELKVLMGSSPPQMRPGRLYLARELPQLASSKLDVRALTAIAFHQPSKPGR